MIPLWNVGAGWMMDGHMARRLAYTLAAMLHCAASKAFLLLVGFTVGCRSLHVYT